MAGFCFQGYGEHGGVPIPEHTFLACQFLTNSEVWLGVIFEVNDVHRNALANGDEFCGMTWGFQNEFCDNFAGDVALFVTQKNVRHLSRETLRVDHDRGR